MLLEVSPRETSCLVVFLVALLTAWNSTSNDFVWDDRSAVLTNADVQSSDLLDVFSHDFWGTPIRSVNSHKSFRPLTILTFRLNFILANGHSAWFYHFTNALVHAGCSALVWRVGDVLFQQHEHRLGVTSARENPQDADPIATDAENKSAIRHEPECYRVGAVAAGLLFAVHPIHSDAVASIVGRADLLCTSLSLSAFLVYVGGAKRSKTQWREVALALVLTIAAGLCKELGFTTFALLAVYDLLRSGYYLQVDSKLTVMKKRLAVVVIVGMVAAVVRVWINGEHRQMKWNILANNVVVQESQLTRMLSYAHVHAFYLWKLVWPRVLCFDYGYNTIPVIESLVDIRNVHTLLAYTVVLVGLRKAVLQFWGSTINPPSSLLLMCIAFGVVPFVPASNIFFPVGTVVAERLMYFPSVGFCLLLGCIADQTFSILNKYCTTIASVAPVDGRMVGNESRVVFSCFKAARVTIVTCSAILLTAGCYRSHLRNADWANEQILFKAAVDVVPTNVKVLSNQAKNLLNSNPYKALDYLRIAIGMIPKHIESQTNAGLAFVSAGARRNHDEDLFLHGIRHLYKSAMLAPNHFQSPGFIGGELFTHWIKTHVPNRKASMENFLASEAIASATKFLDHAISRKSVYPSHFFNRGNIAFESGDYDTAITFYRMTEVANTVVRDRKVDPELLVEASSIYNMLGVSFEKKGEVDKALEMLRKGIALYPMETDLYINAALILQHKGETLEADAQLKAGLIAATERGHIQKLHHIAKTLEASIMPKAVDLVRSRIADLEQEYSL